MKNIRSKIFWLTLFSIAMGYMESAVVVYLRKIYYPDGFRFPLVAIHHQLAATEFWREAATILMLAAIGILAGRTKAQRFAFFVYCFAIWDLFYYVFLKVILDWPESLFTWDILFLIPVPWVGPVIAPCIISLSMIILTLIIIYYSEKRVEVNIQPFEWLLFTGGSSVLILSFIWDYIKYVKELGRPFWTLSDEQALFSEIAGYVPQQYSWGFFFIGQAIILFAIWKIYKRMSNELKISPR